MRAAPAGANAKLILVIADDPLVMEAMGGLLQKWGYEVLTAATERAALDKLAERRRTPDLIVCDYHLLRGTGVETIRRLRGALQIPALLVTSEFAGTELAQAWANDIHVVRKPTEPKMLRTMVRQLLDDSGGGE